MRIFHTSDWHLGRMLYGRSLLRDQRWFLENALLPAVKREKPAALLLCGDVYDRPVAPPEAIALLDETLSQLMELGVKVLVISGNHDGAGRMALLKGALRKSGVYFCTALEDFLRPVLIEEEGLKVQVFPLPFFDPPAAQAFLGDETLRGEAVCMEKLIERALPLFAPGAAHVLMAHCFCAGASVSDSESGSYVGGSGQVPPALFDAFDYAALGHLHGPQRAGEKARYSGTPLKYSLDEAGQKKGFLSLNWDGESFSIEHRETAPPRDVRKLSGLFHELLRAGEESPCEDYVELELTDKAPVLLASERLRPFYPNLLAVRSQWLTATAGERARKLQGAGEDAVFEAFFREVSGEAPEEEDLRLFREVLGEVRP